MAKKSVKGFTIHFLPYIEIEDLDSSQRVKKLLSIILKNKIIILQGRLRVEEETRLIEDTMALVGNVKGFKGVELAVMTPGNEKRRIMSKLKHGIARALIGEQDALTIIGPASIITDMRRDPKKLEIFMGK